MNFTVSKLCKISAHQCGSLPNIYLMNNKDIHLELLQKIELNPEYTQRELSMEMGVSLGKVNYCLNKLIKKGAIKLSNFSNSNNKVHYIYLLTPNGIEEKVRLTYSFLKIKIKEFEILKDEISMLEKDTKKFKSN